MTGLITAPAVRVKTPTGTEQTRRVAGFAHRVRWRSVREGGSVAGEPEFDQYQHGVLASADAGSAAADIDEPLSDQAKQHLADLRDTDANLRDLHAEVREPQGGGP
jgi:hypothetical protein